jgi:hypothetical protein
MLASLPVKEYITTNYDLLFEQAAEATGEKVRVLPYEPDQPSGKWLLKMHGCILHENDIVLTREHYLRYNERNQALAGIVQAMLITKHMLFLGFSLSDDNFYNIASTVRKSIRTSDNKSQDAPFGTSVALVDNPSKLTINC